MTVVNKPKPIFLKDYTPPPYTISEVFLTFDLNDSQTVVKSNIKFKSLQSQVNAPLVLYGERLKLLSIQLDGKELKEEEYLLDNKTLILENVNDEFTLDITVEIDPKANTFLDGLYKSKNIFCTQNEPLGFRKITYFLDRPDVMTTYKTKIIADKKKYPILLSNGNKIDSGDLDNGKHFVTWHDPFKKPSYLFALVAGDLACIEDSFMRRSKKPVTLQIFCEKGDENKCLFAMQALKKSMKWDEDVYNLEYDLDIFMIVAVDAFNAGAMENKGLNIFNTSCILADQASATDDNFIRVEKVIAHEYFHNWTGNRVTLKNWFQLTLKEGLTVFRDQEFTSDMNSRDLHRIENVSHLRQHQFPEDAGPTAHPIRPSSYIEMNNFYTCTVYDKGAEIIRMIHTLLGQETFLKGIAKYFELFDGQAVTCDDFIKAMEIASNKDLSQFKRWYEQKGTPHLEVKMEYNQSAKTVALTITQTNPKEGENSPPLYFPFTIGLLDSNGKDFPINNNLIIKDKSQTFSFKNITSKPTLSLNREFSAPVIIDTNYSIQDYIFLMANDSDGFNRWESSQALALKLILSLIEDEKNKRELELDPGYLDAFGKLLTNDQLDPALKAMALALPSESLLGAQQKVIEIDANHNLRQFVRKSLSKEHESSFREIYDQLNQDSEYNLDPLSIGRRRLKGICLSYLVAIETSQNLDLCFDQYKNATNMTDQFSALMLLSTVDCPQREEALSSFYQKWKKDLLVITKWLSIQALSPIKNTISIVQKLTKDKVLDYKIPNLIRALIGSFLENHIHFHALDGSGYEFIEQQISKIDEINPQVAARLSNAFRKYPKIDPKRKELMKKMLQNLLNKKDLSSNTYEIISKSLEAGNN